MNPSKLFIRNIFPYSLAVVLLCTSIIESSGQEVVKVHREGFHKPIYTTDHFRILNVNLFPGDTSEFHLHDTPILYINLRACAVTLFEADESVRTVPLPNGWIGSDYYTQDSSFVHKIAPSETDTLHILAFQLKEVSRIKTEPRMDSDASYAQDGFEVNSDVDIEQYLNAKMELPLIVRAGKMEFDGRSLMRGSLVTQEELIQLKKTVDISLLSFWQVSDHFVH